MLRLLFSSALLMLTLAACGEGDLRQPGTFPCGIHGGTCQTGVEVCVVGDGECSTCVPLEKACTASDGCGCLDDVDFSSGDFPCADAPMCMPSGDGLAIGCAADGWGCG